MIISRAFCGLAFLTIMISASTAGCSFINKKAGLKDDNIAEELIESLIENKTGLDLDLSPETPEQKCPCAPM